MHSEPFSRLSDHAKYVGEFERSGIPVFKPYAGGSMSAQLGGFRISAFVVPHDNESCCGFLIQHPETTLLYMTDLEYCPYVFKRYRPDTLLIEANYSREYVSEEVNKREHVLRGHCELQTTLDIIEANKTDALRTVILCHLSQESADPIEFVEKVKKVAGNGILVDYASKGKEWELTNGDKCPFM